MYACTSPVCFNARCITLCVWLISEHCANCSLIYRDTQYIVIQTYNNRDTYFPISWQHYRRCRVCGEGGRLESSTGCVL